MMPESAACTESPIAVLHVDDNSFDRALIRDSLAESDFEFRLLQASSRAEFEAYLETPADVILSDFNILGYDGLEVIDQVQKCYPHIPVIIVTGTGTEEIAVEALKRGAADYVIKTTNHIRRLPMTIQKVLLHQKAVIERSSAQEKLAESEKRLRRIIEGCADGAWEWPDVDCENIWWSPRFYEILGYTPAELSPSIEGFSKLVHPDDRRRIDNDIKTLSQCEGTFDSEYRIRTKSGRYIWAQTRGCSALDPESGVMYMSGMMRDITERYEAERRFRASESRMRRVIEGSNDGIWEWTDFSSDEFWWSSRFFEILGYEDREFTPNLKRFSELLHPDDRETVLANISNVAASGESFATRYRLRRKDGNYVWIEARGRTQHDESGRVRSISGFVRDLTNEVEGQRQLEENEALLNNIVELVSVGGFEWDLVSGSFSFTEQWKQIHGVKDQTLTEAELESITWPEDWPKIAAAFENCRTHGSDYKIEHRIIHQQSQEVRWIRALGKVERDASGVPTKMLGAVLDITDEMRLHQEREKRAALLQRLMDSIPSPIFYKDTNLRYQGCNRTFAEFFGLTAEEIVGETVHVLAPAELAAIYDTQDRALLTRGGEQTYEARALRHDGVHRQVVFHKATYFDADGNVDGLIGVMTDVTQRRQQELAVRVSQERLASAIAGGKLGIWDWDLITNEIIWDGFHEEMFGFKKNEFDGTFASFESRIHPDDLATLVGECRLSLQQHRDYRCDYRIVLPDGTIRWIFGCGRYIWNEQGQPVRMIGTVFNVTERKQAEGILRESARFLQSTLDALSANICILNEHGDIIFTNAAWDSFALSNSRDASRAFQGVNYLDVCDQATGPGNETAATVASGIRDVLSGGATDFTHEYDCHSPEEQRWFVVRVNRFFESGLVRAVVAHEEITRRVLAEQATRRRERELAKVFEMAPARLLLLDENCQVVRMNRAAAQHCCTRPHEEPVGKMPGVVFRCSRRENSNAAGCCDSSCAACTLRAITIHTLQSGENHFHEVHRLRCSDGDEETELVLMVSTVRLQMEGQTHVLLYINDITEQENAREQLRAHENHHAHLGRIYTVGEMATALAHELNQPLYAINNYASGIQHRLQQQIGFKDHNQLVNAMARISDEVSRAGSIISHLREFIRAREPRKVLVKPKEIIQRAFGLLDIVARENEIEYELKIPRDLPDVYVDSIQIEQVLINLVTNAIESSAGLDKVRRKLVVTCQLRDSNSLEFEVQDTGRGVSPDLEKSLFEPFATNNCTF